MFLIFLHSEDYKFLLLWHHWFLFIFLHSENSKTLSLYEVTWVTFWKVYIFTGFPNYMQKHIAAVGSKLMW